MKVAVTGSNGFVGKHLCLKLSLLGYEVVQIDRSKWDYLTKHLENIKIIFHCAGVNRPDQEKDYLINELMANQLLSSIDKSTKKIIYTNSSHSLLNSAYGNSKKRAADIFENFCTINEIEFKNYLFPNIYGVNSKPYYNTVVATFIDQITKEEDVKIIQDKVIDLISIEDVVEAMIYDTEFENNLVSIKVSELRDLIKNIFNTYKTGIIPDTNKKINRTLLGMILNSYKLPNLNLDLSHSADKRGFFMEVFKSKGKGQVSFSHTPVGKVKRGNHFHTKKIERFYLLKGSAEVEVKNIFTKKVEVFDLNEKNRIIDIPPYNCHTLINTGDNELEMLFWIDEFYSEEKHDTYGCKI